MGWQRRKVYRGYPEAVWGPGQDKLRGQQDPSLWARAGVGVGLSHRPPFQLGKRRKSEAFLPEMVPSCWGPGTSHWPLWASVSPYVA